MLGWILFGLFTAAVGVIVINGIVNKSSIKQKMLENKLEEVMVTEVNKCTNTVKLESLFGNETLEIRGDGIDDNLEEFDIITV